MMLKDKRYYSRLMYYVALALILQAMIFSFCSIDTEGMGDDHQDKLDDSLVIVTAASENHYYAIVSTIYSAQKIFPNATFIVYDLGFSPSERDSIKQFKNVQYRYFDFSQYPTWMHLYKGGSNGASQKSPADARESRSKKAERAGQWAWKPIIMKEVAETTRYANILWLDGDTNVRKYPQDMFDALKNQGVFTTDSVGNSTEWIHPKMLEHYNIDMRRNVLKMAHAGRVGFNLKNNKAKSVLNGWVDCAMKKECIAPEGSNIFNHRQDQAALTVLMGMEGLHYGNERESSFIGHYPLPDNIEEWEQSLKRNRIDTD